MMLETLKVLGKITRLQNEWLALWLLVTSMNNEVNNKLYDMATMGKNCGESWAFAYGIYTSYVYGLEPLV